MQLNPKSKAIIDQLDDSKSIATNDATIGPFDKITKDVLKVLIENYDSLKILSGENRAKNFVTFYETFIKVKKTDTKKQEAQTHLGITQDKISESKPHNRWYIHNIKCHSIRGIDLYGETFPISFEGKSNLIYGPNGSGKSSLLSAVIWALAGITVTDASDDNQETGVHRKTTDIKKGRKLCNWPLITTLPETDNIQNVTPDSWVIIELQTKDQKQSLYIKRSLEKGLEVGSNENDLKTCNNLEEYGINPLDIQISLIAPTVLSRNTLENATDTVKILSMILGYDNLNDIGDLARDIGANRTSYSNSISSDITQDWQKLSEKIVHLADPLPENSKSRKKLILKSRPTVDELAEKRDFIQSEIKSADDSIAKILGITEDDKAKEGLAEKLIEAIGFLEKDFTILFPSFSNVKYEKSTFGNKAIEEIEGTLLRFLANVKKRITRRIEWWKRVKKEGSKVDLKLRAAQDYNPESMICPVCDQSIKDLPIKNELEKLKSVDQELQGKLKDFFNGLSEELEKIIPLEIRNIGNKSPSERILEDWQTIQKSLDKRLANIVKNFESKIVDVCNAIPEIKVETITFFDETDKELSDKELLEAAGKFTIDTNNAVKAIAFLNWGQSQYEGIKDKLEEVIKTASADAPSLLSELSKNKGKALDIKPLNTIKTQLIDIITSRKTIETLENKHALLEKLKPPIDEIKKISKYALEETGKVFKEIKTIADKNWKLLYKESPTGLVPSKLVLERGKTIESFLSKQNYEVAGKYFANSSLQRSIALSFLCAMLEKNIGGLAFVLFDDPILSLDEDHRERWIHKVIGPIMKQWQVILATHQEHILNSCNQDFIDECILKLNHRARKKRLSLEPGYLLDRAEYYLQENWEYVPVLLYNYAEYLLETLDSYSPDAFFNKDNFANSFKAYKNLPLGNPLTSKNKSTIVNTLSDKTVENVFKKRHLPTSHGITKAMTEDACKLLKGLDENAFKRELKRLKDQWAKELRGNILIVSSDKKTFTNIAINKEIKLPIIGRAAARPESWVIESLDRETISIIQNFACVRVTSHSFDPVARCGQCVLLANTDNIIVDGDLVVGESSNCERYLRRIAFSEESAFLYSINPIKIYPPLQVNKDSLLLYKVIGVLYEPCKNCTSDNSHETNEWHPCKNIDLSYFDNIKMITVEGDSLEPIARKGQKVLVREHLSPKECTIESGGLAVIETEEGTIGDEIKRVYRNGDSWTLISANPLVPYKPDIVPIRKIKKVWPLCGVIFESMCEE